MYFVKFTTNIIIFLDSETILKTLQNRSQLQRYANNTIKSYCGYAQIFLEYMSKYRTLNETPIAEIEGFNNEKVFQDNIGASYKSKGWRHYPQVVSY